MLTPHLNLVWLYREEIGLLLQLKPLQCRYNQFLLVTKLNVGTFSVLVQPVQILDELGPIIDQYPDHLTRLLRIGHEDLEHMEGIERDVSTLITEGSMMVRRLCRDDTYFIMTA